MLGKLPTQRNIIFSITRNTRDLCYVTHVTHKVHLNISVQNCFQKLLKILDNFFFSKNVITIMELPT